MKRLTKVILSLVLGLMAVSTLYLSVADPDINIEVIADNYDNLSSKTAFYTFVKEDWVDYIEKIREEQDSVGNTPGGSIAPIGGANSNDLRELAKIVANRIMESKTETGDASNSGKEYYCTNLPGTRYEVKYGTIRTTLRFRCCTTMVYGIKVLSGDTYYASIATSNPWSCSTTIDDFESKSPQSLIPVGEMTYGELNVGDIVIRDGHTEIVVYKDSTSVYVANGGSDNGIMKTAQDGYARTHPINLKIKDWQPNGASPFEYVLRW